VKIFFITKSFALVSELLLNLRAIRSLVATKKRVTPAVQQLSFHQVLCGPGALLLHDEVLSSCDVLPIRL